MTVRWDATPRAWRQEHRFPSHAQDFTQSYTFR
jgi:hypothetical protein